MMPIQATLETVLGDVLSTESIRDVFRVPRHCKPPPPEGGGF
jgi:hypothetical protein